MIFIFNVSFAMKRILFLVFLMAFCTSVFAQHKSRFTNEAIWKQRKFSASSMQGIKWMEDGKHCAILQYNPATRGIHILKHEIESGKVVDTLLKEEDFTYQGEQLGIEDYQLSPGESYMLLAAQQTPVYRYSRKAHYYIYHRASGKVTKLDKSGVKQQEASFSPDGSKVAYVKDNDLYYKDIDRDKIVRVTQTGKKGHIINGHTDWVYEEEFQFTKAFFWDNQSRMLAYYVFDESRVPEYELRTWKGLYPDDEPIKYPKAGEKNAIVAVKVYHTGTGETVNMDIGTDTNQYIPRVKWTKNDTLLSIRSMNRMQDTLDILHANALSGDAELILRETRQTYIDISDELTYLDDGEHFVQTSDKDGYKHIYLYNMDGTLAEQITEGEWEVDKLKGIDEKNKKVYYTAAEVSPLERHFYSKGYGGNDNKTRLTQKSGVHKINLSTGYNYFIDYFSDKDRPYVITLKNAADGKTIKTYEDNQRLVDELEDYAMGEKTFFTFKTEDGTKLNGFMIKPPGFDPSGKYPVLMNTYGGPGVQTVMNQWGGSNYIWHQMLAQKGYIIAGIDNRGTGGRGAEFQKCTYARLGELETKDHIAAAEYLGDLAYVDAERIGIWGWSYGGYLTSLCLTVGAEAFSTGVAIAPVTSWRFYDTIYTERYLKTPQKNPDGYDDYSPVNHAAKLQGDLLLVHGMADDNVHLQHSIAFQDALIREGKQFQSFFYPNRHHGIYGGNARYHLYEMMTNFITNNL